MLLCLDVAVAATDLYGLAYAPYRYWGACPTTWDVNQDVALLKQHTGRVRTYSTECPEVLDILFNNGFSVMMGVWIDGKGKDQQEIDDLIVILRQHPNANIHGIVVGNEVLYRRTMTPTQVADRVKETKQKVLALADELGNDYLRTVPVFSIEVFPHPEVVAVSDAVGANIHPFYQKELPGESDPEAMATRAVEGTTHVMNLFKSFFPGKRFIIGEVGWPTSSLYSEAHRGSLEVTKIFLQKWREYANNAGVEYFWFELCDSEWKKPHLMEPDAWSDYHFGLFGSDRAPKLW